MTTSASDERRSLFQACYARPVIAGFLFDAIKARDDIGEASVNAVEVFPIGTEEMPFGNGAQRFKQNPPRTELK